MPETGTQKDLLFLPSPSLESGDFSRAGTSMAPLLAQLTNIQTEDVDLIRLESAANVGKKIAERGSEKIMTDIHNLVDSPEVKTAQESGNEAEEVKDVVAENLSSAPKLSIRSRPSERKRAPPVAIPEKIAVQKSEP